MATRVAVLGAGPGGYVAALRAAQLGADVTVVEEDNVGGTCLNWGCVPSKVMITTAELLVKLRRSPEFGIEVDGRPRIDLEGLMARKNRVVQDQIKGILDLLRRRRVTLFKGRGTVTGPGTLAVRQAGGENLEVPWDRLILAVGTRPADIPAFPFDGERVLSSNHALDLRRIPRSVLIVGGGVIGCEFAFILEALGCRVTLVEAMSRLLPLPSLDEACSKVLQREMKKRRIRFLLRSTAEEAVEADGGLRVTIGPSSCPEEPPGHSEEGPTTVDVDQVLVCIGRRPNTEGIGLDRIGLKTDERGWLVANDRMETGASNVHAIGDVLGPTRIMLAHAASAEGRVAAENALGAGRPMDYACVPTAIFTSPEVAAVGLSETQARAQGLNLRTDTALFRSLGKAQILGEIAGEAKIVSEAESGRILGVHMIGPHATDLISEAALALRMGATVEDLAETIHPHPTLAEIMPETALKALERALHA